MWSFTCLLYREDFPLYVSVIVWLLLPHPHRQSCCKDFKGCFVGSLGCIRDLTKVEVKALSFSSFFFFATVNLLILQSVEQQWINLFKVCIHKENLNFSGLNAWTAVWWLKGRHLQLALEGGRQSAVTCSSAQVLTPRSIPGLLTG